MAFVMEVEGCRGVPAVPGPLLILSPVNRAQRGPEIRLSCAFVRAPREAATNQIHVLIMSLRMRSVDRRDANEKGRGGNVFGEWEGWERQMTLMG